MNRGKALQSGLLTCLLALLAGCAHRQPVGKPPRPFSYARDTLAFSNETVWTYRDGVPVAAHKSESHDPNGERFTHRCFTMTRATLLFWKFARFDPHAPPLEGDALTTRIRAVLDINPLDAALPADKRIVVPGYANLRDFSEREGVALRRNLANPCQTYLRPGNMWIAYPYPRWTRERVHAELRRSLEAGQPMALWMYNFPHVNMNHCVLAYAIAPPSSNTLRYGIYDPNFASTPGMLEFDSRTRVFSFPRVFYYSGGPVKVRPVYVSWFQ